MANAHPPAQVTAAEAAVILARLEHRPCSVAQVRSVLVLDTRGRAIAPRAHGDTRLYSAVDVALARLAFRLRADGVSPTVARVIVACLRDDLARIWQDGDPMALAVVGMRGLLVYAEMPKPTGIAAWVPLRMLWREVIAAIRAVRRTEPTVWHWRPRPVQDVAAGA